MIPRMATLSDTGGQNNCCKFLQSATRVILGAALFLVGIFALIGVAVWNGFPIVFFDSFWYILSALHGFNDGQKSLGYAEFLHWTEIGRSLWSVILAQAICVYFVLKMTGKVFGLHLQRHKQALLIFALVLTRSLSWEVSHLLPDVFTAVAVLCLFLLLTEAASFSSHEKAGISALFILSFSVHASNYLLLSGLFAAALMRALVSRRRGFLLRILILPAVLLFCSFSFVIALNKASTGRVYLHSTSHVFIGNRLIEDGIAQKLLKEHCSDTPYILCKYADSLSTNRLNFLFSHPETFNAIGGWTKSSGAFEPIIRDSLRYYPWEVIKESFKQAGEQLIVFHIADFIFRMSEDRRAAYMLIMLKTDYPNEYAAFMASKQQQKKLSSSALARFHDWVVCICAALIPLLYRRVKPSLKAPLLELICLCSAAIFLNAFICGALSHFEPRYGSRVIWLVPLCAFLAFGSWQSSRASHETKKHQATPEGCFEP